MFFISLNIKAGSDTTSVSSNQVSDYDPEESTVVEEELQLEDWMFNFGIQKEKSTDISETEIQLEDWMLNFDIKNNERSKLAERVAQLEN